MQQYDDQFGQPFTASNAKSVIQFSKLVRAYLGFRPETGGELKKLLLDDPHMPMALCAKGYFAKLIGSASHSARATGIAEKLQSQVKQSGMNKREIKHVSALAAWCNGELDEATKIWEEILLDYPLDEFALKLSHFTHFYSGDGRRMRDSIAGVLPQWPRDHPHLPYVWGMYGFGLEESGDYVQAEHYGRMAVDANPEDAWSVHAVTHVMEMTGRYQQGIEWIASLEPSWSKVNNFRFHLYWHQCLFYLERGEKAEVLRLFDDQIVSDIEAEFYLDICNATSLLWRLELHGVDVGDRWQRVAAVSKTHTNDMDLIFVSLHHLMALVANDDHVATEEMMSNLINWSHRPDTQGKIATRVGLAIAEALKSARLRDFNSVVNQLEAVRYDMDIIGGSKAQRDVFNMILLDALKKSKATQQSCSHHAARVQEKPNSSWSWQGYRDALSKLGKEDDANMANEKALALLG